MITKSANQTSFYVKRRTVVLVFVIALSGFILFYFNSIPNMQRFVTFQVSKSTTSTSTLLNLENDLFANDTADYIKTKSYTNLIMVKNKDKSKMQGYVIATPGCRIPDLPTTENNTRKYFKIQSKDPRCGERWWPLFGKRKQRGPPLIKSNLTTLWVHQEALKKYNISSTQLLSCCYRPFWRIQDNPHKYHTSADDHSKFSKKCIQFKGEYALVSSSEEFVRVECSIVKNNKKIKEIYRDFHVFMPRKPKVEERSKKLTPKSADVNILIIGMDSISRLNMIRQLPKTYDVLKSEPFSAMSLLGYNKVGDNTFPNLVPLLMGVSDTEIKNICIHNQKEKFDLCPFIWKNFSAKGFKTAYGEDYTPLSTFNYERTGFVEQPVDYYARPFFMESLRQQGHVKILNTKMCTGPRQLFENSIDYIKKFANQFAKDRYFAFFWSSAISHDNMNMPHIGDESLANLIIELQGSGALNSTVLILMSDHGMRWGAFRETYQGRIEERLPFVLISLPSWFRQQYFVATENLKLNSENRLTTPYDLHETLLDLLEPKELLSTEMILERENVFNESYNNFSRGISLFLPISPERTCEHAGIDLHWCTCQASTPVSTSLQEIKNSVNYALKALNKILQKYSQCQTLQLKLIKSAEKINPHDKGVGNKIQIPVVDYLIVFSTQPGEAVFEATVRHKVKNKKTSTVELAGQISRLNAYGNQSYCVTDVKIKLYCYCKTLL